MKKIGLITLHRWFNYGSMLQSYAANRLLNDMGYDCELIDYTPPQIDNRRSYKLYNEDAEWDAKRVQYSEQIEKRKRAFNMFMELYKTSTSTYGSDDELLNNPPKYDAYVTGSDQIWNVNMRIASKAYFLHFTNSDEKYAFSTSVGRCKEDKLQPYQEYMHMYKKIYMREEDGVNLIQHMCPNTYVDQMIDPTLILDREIWNDIIEKQPMIQGEYIACYATLDDELDDMMPIIRRVYQEKKIPIVLFGMILPREEEGIMNIVDAGPFEFIRLIRDASLLITHSFHGTAFALNFNVPFMTYNDSMENPRKEGVLRMVGLDNRIIHNVEEAEAILKKKIDFAHANEVLEAARRQAKETIKECLGD
ncbi:MAG: polysaccharide pyruvyl transferase family protein [Lachnospiraceae bacterium]|nr:polysaccharide pyruvyl transferase family protein [Lachnospiraceae bacterium]